MVNRTSGDSTVTLDRISRYVLSFYFRLLIAEFFPSGHPEILREKLPKIVPEIRLLVAFAVDNWVTLIGASRLG